MTTQAYDDQTADAIIRDFDARPEALIQILHAFMARFGHVPELAVRKLADALNLSRADVHGVVSYYHDFRTTPAGRHVVRICQAEACQAMGSRDLSAHAEASLAVGMHETTPDVTLEPVYCLGNCACAPAVMIDGRTFGRVTGERLDALVAAMRGGSA